MEFAIADEEERRDIASEIEQCVQLDGRFGRTKRSPRKHRQAQIDGGGIQSVNGFSQIDSKGRINLNFKEKARR